MKKIILMHILALSILLFTSCFNTKNIWNRYENNFKVLRVSENDVNISAYQPFSSNNRVAILDSVSVLKLQNNLPVLDGATALYPLYSAFAQSVYPPEGKKNVRYTNTMNAYKALINKKTDIIFVAQPSKEQLEMADKAGVTLRLVPVAKDAFVFFVNANNPVSSLTVNQVHDIYSGKIVNWSELGGQNDTIVPFQRNVGSGSQTAFLNFMKDKEIIPPRKDKVIFGMGMMISRVADYVNYPNSIGFSFRYFVNEVVANKQIKLLKINEIYPDLESIKNNVYPLSSYLFAITLTDNTNPNIEKMLNWIKSVQGQELVKKTGYCSIY
jgi:phosphate transport system substrate-binding protein